MNDKKNGMDLLGIGSAIQGISGIVQGAMNSKTAKRNTDLTNAANRELAQYGYSKDLEMWERANEYNNPANQMLRMKEAGLNPNMVYGSGKVAGNTASQLPKYNAPKQDFNYQPVVQNLPNMLGQYMDFRLKNAQYDNATEQGRLIKEKADAEATGNEFLRQIMESKSQVWQQKGLASWAKQQWEWGDNDGSRSNNRIGAMLDYGMDNQREKVRQLQQAIKESEQRERTGSAQTRSLMQGIKESKSRTNLADSNYDLNVLKGSQLQSQIDKTNKELEWYETKLFSDLGFKFLGNIKDLVSMPRAGKGAKGKSMRNVKSTRDWSQWK